jgi:hypothetical protein
VVSWGKWFSSLGTQGTLTIPLVSTNRQTGFLGKDDYVTAANVFVDVTAADYVSVRVPGLEGWISSRIDLMLQPAVLKAVSGLLSGGERRSPTRADPTEGREASPGVELEDPPAPVFARYQVLL